MKKLISYTLVFVLGFGVCALILYRMGYAPSSGSQSVIEALSGKPAPPVIRKGQNPIADAAAAVGPAVVNIDTMGERRVINPFDQFFFGMQAPEIMQKFVGQGSGVIISSDGYILTNNHVIAGAQDITVRLSDGRKFKAKLIGRDENSEIAVVKVDARKLPVARLGNSDAIRVGDWAIAIGNPLGLGNTVTVGVISAKNRENLPVAEGAPLRNAIQTDAPINPGNSGGALANINGEVIGITSAILSTDVGEQKGSIGLGFAIPINSAKAIAKEIIKGGGSLKNGEKTQPWLGVYVDTLGGDLQTWYRERGYKAKSGAVVMYVQPGSPAEKAGLMRGDIITEIDGKKVGSSPDVVKAIGKYKVGQVVRISAWRDKKTLLLGAKLAELPPGAGSNQ